MAEIAARCAVLCVSLPLPRGVIDAMLVSKFEADAAYGVRRQPNNMEIDQAKLMKDKGECGMLCGMPHACLPSTRLLTSG